MSALEFELPAKLEAGEPPEARGLARDEVRLLVARRSSRQVAHARFRELPSLLAPGDLILVNVSATLAAALPAQRDDGTPIRVHFATRVPQLGSRWRVVELRSADGAAPLQGHTGERIALRGAAQLELVAPYAAGARLMLARFDGTDSVETHLARHGEPIRYGYATDGWPLQAYQTVYASSPGSAEMPSAGRPFSAELITRLAGAGVIFAPITLHAGVSSPERHEPPAPEYFEVPQPTARLVQAVHGWGGRVIAVGTTVARALETVTDPEGTVAAGSGWTSLVIDSQRGLRAIDGLITGWHEPQASHLGLLEAAAGEALLARSYRTALKHGYRWHEFGDSHLILP
ncbi:MAG: S-adenosylmethionine:tRNA ribosyltransferase-isomerase [Solirubrobacteraceae bacterium]